jgi:hypothetical protein
MKTTLIFTFAAVLLASACGSKTKTGETTPGGTAGPTTGFASAEELGRALVAAANAKDSEKLGDLFPPDQVINDLCEGDPEQVTTGIGSSRDMLVEDLAEEDIDKVGFVSIEADDRVKMAKGREWGGDVCVLKKDFELVKAKLTVALESGGENDEELHLALIDGRWYLVGM